MEYSIKCATAKYDPDVNAVREDIVKEFDRLEWKKAEQWLDKMEQKKIPAYFYMDGMQDHDAFLDFFHPTNSYYWKEYKKVID